MDTEIREEDLKEIEEEASEIKESKEMMLETRADLAKLEDELGMIEKPTSRDENKKPTEKGTQGMNFTHL